MQHLSCVWLMSFTITSSRSIHTGGNFLLFYGSIILHTVQPVWVEFCCTSGCFPHVIYQIAYPWQIAHPNLLLSYRIELFSGGRQRTVNLEPCLERKSQRRMEDRQVCLPAGEQEDHASGESIAESRQQALLSVGNLGMGWLG